VNKLKNQQEENVTLQKRIELF